MALVHLFFLFLQIAIGNTLISWDDCDKVTNDIKLLNLTVNPDPIIAPGSVSITITIYSNQNITSPLKATLSLKKKIFIGYIPVPCFSIGSCVYDDLCAICQECNCPLIAGEHTLNLPINIDSSSWMLSGNYQAEINFESKNSKQKVCVKIMNISIETKK